MVDNRKISCKRVESRLLEEKKQFAVSKKDVISMTVITIIFLLFGFFRLGSTKAPESFMTFGTKEGNIKGIILNFSTNEDIASFEIYLGAKHDRSASFFVAQDEEWSEYLHTQKLKSVFAWNHVEIREKTWQAHIIFLDEEAEIGEIICLNSNGNVILPQNANEYPELFDEQECYTNPPTYYNQTMFDEVYHARTAYEFLHELPIYENTHPTFGKILISIGIAIFGMNPFGYRIICLLFGTLMIPIIYLFALRLTNKTSYATLAGILLTTEFMHYTLSRIATIDIIAAFFVLCMFYGIFAFIQEEKQIYLLMSGVASAFGVATKWTALYALLGLAIIIFAWMLKKWFIIGYTKKNRKSWWTFIGSCTGYFVLLPLVVYVLSFIPFTKVYPGKGIIELAIAISNYMYQYHSNLIGTHHYASPWYSWLIDWLPLLDSRTAVGTNVSVVATFINPLICILGLVAVGFQIFLAVVKKNTTSKILLIFYFVMLAPWMFITRTVFIYQYFICTQVLILMICHTICCMKFKNEDKVIRRIAMISIILFIIFFPVISGMEVSRNYVEGFLKWLPEWKFVHQ